MHPRSTVGYDPERHPQGVHGAQYLYLSAEILDEDHRRHLRIHLEEHAEVQLDFDLRLPYAGGRRHGRHRVGLHAGRRSGVPACGRCSRYVGGCFRTPSVVLLGDRYEPLHGDRQDACGTYALGEDRQKIQPQNPKSLALRTHSQTSGWSLTEQDPFNNVARTAIEAMGAALGHTQSLHTNALDEAIALPTDFSARIARNTQIYIQEETTSCREVDPWAGSYYIETLTNEIAHKAWERIEEVEKLGGMAKAIETGIPKMRIEEAAARKQARIDSGIEKIIGVNEYRLDHEAPIDILAVDNTAVRESQIKRLKELRANRDEAAVKKALEAITECVKTGKGNLLELAIEAAKVRASLGEIRMPARWS